MQKVHQTKLKASSEHISQAGKSQRQKLILIIANRVKRQAYKLMTLPDYSTVLA